MPLAMLLPDEEIRRCTARGDTATKCALSTHVDKIITLPIEPKVTYTFIWKLLYMLPSAVVYGNVMMCLCMVWTCNVYLL